ncbi:MAG TPA: hypothetical protein QGH10_27500 [Armatimonadota bacterium]|nr:hypothetical protein [Armatimonadota bacterium]
MGQVITLTLVALLVFAFFAQAAVAESEDMGEGFFHHGVATPVSNHRGIVATVDGDGRNVALIWLYDHTGCYALLMVDAETGEAEQFPMPWKTGDCPFASVLSTKNRFYSHFGNHFCEFDPVKREFTFFSETVPQMAMSMTEGPNGVIWSATYPNSGVASYNPETGDFRDYGHVHEENWRQYPRAVAADDAGWVYFGIGSTNAHVIGLNAETGEAKPMVPESERGKGTGPVYADNNGKVYGQTRSSADLPWYEFYGGVATKLDEPPTIDKTPIIASSQSLFHTRFPDGKILKRCDTVEAIIAIEDPATGEITQNSFDYTSEGDHMMGMAAGPSGTIIGGTAFPMRCFIYDPETDELTNRAGYSQWNTVVTQGDRFFVGGYGHGILLEYDPTSEWVPTVKDKAGCNPLFLAECPPTINRPHDLLAHPDGKTIVMAGTPGYGYTGGGLMFWDRLAKEAIVIEHTEILPEHSTASLVALPDGKLLGGSTIAAGTGGEQKATVAELYIMDMATKAIDWHEVVFEGISGYADMIVAPNGLVLGIADHKRFFAFNAETREVVYDADISEEFGSTTSGQQSRIFVTGPNDTIYILFRKGIATVDPDTFEITMLAESPVSIGPGGAYLEGRIYFGSGSHVYSYEIPGK